ncbi:hypothetical protein [Brachybacterium sp. GPGPB12]|uniref:three-helix bundle dimerization domain-containing protein n=1 Tax=Brachybacterium sp. GPGPB12 TaxID=3023517 RepID=UPI003134397C
MASQRETPSLLSAEHVLHSIAGDLSRRFTGVFAAETVDRYVFESYTALARTSKITSHLPSLTERFARDRLTALAQAKGAAPHDVPEVLLVCVQNAGRSQMAAAAAGSPRRGSSARPLRRIRTQRRTPPTRRGSHARDRNRACLRIPQAPHR